MKQKSKLGNGLWTLGILAIGLWMVPRVSLGEVQSQSQSQAQPLQPLQPPPSVTCSYAREYITTLEYLRKHKDFSIPEKEARAIALKTAEGCSGAAQRFIRVMSLLIESGLGPVQALQNANEFAARKDEEAETFITVFMTAFLSENMDLDLVSSLKMARSLTVEFQGDVTAVKKDFQKLANYCTKADHLNLPKPLCGAFAARITRKGEKNEGGVADSFIQVFEFLTSDSGPHLIAAQALEKAEVLIEGGKSSVDNFIQAYKYATASDGLNNDVKDAIYFAQQLALTEPKAEKKPQ